MGGRGAGGFPKGTQKGGSAGVGGNLDPCIGQTLTELPVGARPVLGAEGKEGTGHH